MKVLVVYDSVYGNTEKIAKAIGGAIVGDVRVVRANEVDLAGLTPIDLLIVASPTQNAKPTKLIQDFLDRIPAIAVKGVKVAAFDTRYGGRLVKAFGVAANKIAGTLTEKGGNLVAPPEGFIVTGKEGPLKDGEMERAVDWARNLHGSGQ